MQKLTKQELRKILREQRREIADKETADSLIFDRFIRSEYYQRAETILCYVSLEEEISTDEIISRSLQDGKKVAVPLCEDTEGHMHFHLIHSLNDLVNGFFGVREPIKEKCIKLTDFQGAVIIVPGISFNKEGYRIGYGKGYYDRFLKNFPFISIGLCYNSLIHPLPIAEDYDIPVDIIMTQTETIDTHIGGKNG